MHESDKDRLVALTDKMVKQASVTWLMTAEIIKQKFTLKIVSVRTLRDGLLERGVCWRKLREKPISTDDAVKQMYATRRRRRGTPFPNRYPFPNS